MSIVEEYKKQGDLAVQEYLQLLVEEQNEEGGHEEVIGDSKNSLVTQINPGDMPSTQQTSNENYEEEQFAYFASLSKNKTSKCIVCKKTDPKYKCPKCKVQYCSIQHYKSHNMFCTERFFKEQVESQLKATKASTEQKKTMIELLKNNKQQFQSDRNEVDQETKVNQIEQERLNQLLQMIEREQEVKLSENQSKCFERYLKELQYASQAQQGLQIGQNSIGNRKQHQKHTPFEQYKPFWIIQEGLSQYFTFNQPLQIEQYNKSAHKEIIDYRQLSSQLLRQEIPRLLQNVSFKKTSVFANFELIQIVYLTALMFRSLNGDYLHNKQFIDTFLYIYDEHLGKKMAESSPKSSIEALKSSNSVFGLLKNNISTLQPINRPLYDIIFSWLPLILQDCLTIFGNKYLCIQTLMRLLECFKSGSQDQNVKWSDEVMPSGKESKAKSNEQKKRQKNIVKIVKKIQFMICFTSQIVFKSPNTEGQDLEAIKGHPNKEIIISTLTSELDTQAHNIKITNSLKTRSEQIKQRTLNSILIP